MHSNGIFHTLTLEKTLANSILINENHSKRLQKTLKDIISAIFTSLSISRIFSQNAQEGFIHSTISKLWFTDAFPDSFCVYQLTGCFIRKLELSTVSMYLGIFSFLTSNSLTKIYSNQLKFPNFKSNTLYFTDLNLHICAVLGGYVFE